MILAKQQFIRKMVAAVMLIVFAFSITPVIVFHNWLADHTDALRKTSPQGCNMVSTQSYNCDCDDIVAESPFTDTGIEITFAATSFCIPGKVAHETPFISTPHHFFLLRGPPAV